VAPDRFFGRTTPYRLIKCEQCQLAWLADPPAPEEMTHHYGAIYDRFIKKATENDSLGHWQGALRTLNEYRQQGRLLDLGCGAGSFLRCLDSSSWNLWGIEMSADSAELARSRTKAAIIVDDILEAPFPPSLFDVITGFHVLEHTYSPQDIIRKVYGWLKPGGILYLHVPNIDSAELRLFGSYWYPLELPRHLFHFSPASLRRLLRSAGFKECGLITSRASFVEYSLRYLTDEMLRKAGLERPSLADSNTPGLVWRVIRKGLRVTVLPVANWFIGLTGGGSIIEAVFEKPV